MKNAPLLLVTFSSTNSVKLISTDFVFTNIIKTNSFQIDTLDLDDDLESLANYSDDSDDENTTQNVDFTNTYNSDSADNLDTAETIPLGIDMNKVQDSQENTEEQTVNVIKLGS